MLEMMEAVPASVMADVIADARRSSPVAPSSPAGPPVQRGSGFADPTPLKPPDGVQWCDRLMDVQDHQDKLDRIAAEMERRRTLAALKPDDAPRAPPERPTDPDK
jgi:hypothetical protein